MAGSYNHAVNELGQLHNTENIQGAIETGGDAYETIEEMYGMIWWLADGDKNLVESARQHYKQGIEWSPGIEDE